MASEIIVDTKRHQYTGDKNKLSKERYDSTRKVFF